MTELRVGERDPQRDLQPLRGAFPRIRAVIHTWELNPTNSSTPYRGTCNPAPSAPPPSLVGAHTGYASGSWPRRQQLRRLATAGRPTTLSRNVRPMASCPRPPGVGPVNAAKALVPPGQASAARCCWAASPGVRDAWLAGGPLPCQRCASQRWWCCPAVPGASRESPRRPATPRRRTRPAP